MATDHNFKVNNGLTVKSGGITNTGDSVLTGTSGSGGNAFTVNRGSTGSQAIRVQNTGEVVISSNYLYASSSGISLYVQNGSVFRGTITNDGGNTLSISSGSANISFNSKNFTNVGTINSGNISVGAVNSSQTITTSNAAGFVITNQGKLYSNSNNLYLETFTNGTGIVLNSRTGYLTFKNNGTNKFQITSSDDFNFYSGDLINVGTINTGQGATEVYLMNQNVRSSDSPTFQDLTIQGNLSITGDINSYNVTDLDVVDKTITLGVGGTASANDAGGIIVDGANAKLTWDNGDSRWSMNKSLQFHDGPTTTNQGMGIFFTGFDKEATSDYSDNASIIHTINTGGHTGSVLLFSSQNDANDGIAFTTNGSSSLKHNSSNILTAANFTSNVTPVDSTKLPLAGGTMTGTLAMGASAITSTGTISSGQLSATTTADATPAIIATNTGGINGVIQRWIGDSDSMEFRNMDTGDYELMNTQQNNGIVFRDGTGGVEIHYNGNEIVEVGSLGGLVLMSGDLQIPNALVHKDDPDTSIKLDLNRVRIFDGGGTYLDTNNGTAVLHTSTTFGGDVSGTYGAIVVADDSHNHVISNVDGLQTALDAKLPLAGGTMTGNLTVNSSIVKISNTSGQSDLRFEAANDNFSQILFGDTDGTSRATLRYKHDTDTFFIAAGGTSSSDLEITNSAVNVTSGTLQIGGTTVINSSRNLTNIGTISSGAITATGVSVLTNVKSLTDLYLSRNDGTSPAVVIEHFDRFRFITDSTGNYNEAQFGVNTSNVLFTNNGYAINTTTVIDSNRNLTNIGTISSGTVTAANGLYATGIWANNNAPATNDAIYSGYGIIGNRSNYYITNSNSSGIIVIGIGGGHNANPKLTVTTSGITVAGTVTATGGNSTNWNTAYGWGNHASAGYITDGNTNWNNSYGFITASDSSITNKLPKAGGTMTGTLALNNADSLSFESGKHWITYNDGEGNFNIRVGHKSDSTTNEVSTESGYVFHDEWSQSSGWREFNISASSIADGADVGAWRRQMYYDSNSVYLAYQGSNKLNTSSGGISVNGTVTATGGNSGNWNTAYGWGNHASASYATESYVGTQISNLVDSSPSALNTLNELAAALGDDANFSTTVNANIATKLPKAGGTMTGLLEIAKSTSIGDPTLDLHNTTNGYGVNIRMTDVSDQSGQFGYITYYHQDSKSYGSGASITLRSTEATTTILADGKLMYGEGIYSKPATGTGAGTRKDANWDTAYGWGNHASAGYQTSAFNGGTITSDITISNTSPALNLVDSNSFSDTNDRMIFRAANDKLQWQWYDNSANTTTTLLDLDSTGLLISDDHKLNTNHHLQRSDHHSGHLEGSYNNVGDNGSKSNPIYTIGSAYNPVDATLSNMYGIGYTHTNASFISMTGASGWGMYVAADGDARVYLGGSNGVISSTGEHYVGSSRVFHDTYHPNADTLTTARTINGVSFNGSANITVADSSKLPLTGGTVTGNLSVHTGGSSGTFSVGRSTSQRFKMHVTDGLGTIDYLQDETGDYAHDVNFNIISPSTHDNEFKFSDRIVIQDSIAGDATLLALNHDCVSDLGTQRTFIDFSFTDTNSNETPQVRIGAQVGANADAGSQILEGCGAFIIHTNNANTVSGEAGASLVERMRVDYQGNVGINTTTPSSLLDVNGAVTFKAAGNGWADNLNLMSNDGTNKWNLLVDNGFADGLRFGYNQNARVEFSTAGVVTATGFTTPGNISGGFTRAYVAGTNNVQTIVAVLGSNSTRPVLQFSESTANTITAGMSLEYNGQGSGATNYMSINAVTGASIFKVYSGGNVQLTGSAKLLFNNSSNFGVGAGGHNYNSVYVDTLESGSANDTLELVYYQGSGVRIGQSGSEKPLFCGTLDVSGAITTDGNLVMTKAQPWIVIENTTEDGGGIVFNDNQAGAWPAASSQAFRMTYHSGNNSFVMGHDENSYTGFSFASGGNFTATGDVTAYSDERLKSNIVTLDGKKVLDMRGVSFEKDGKEGSGVIAQELEKIAPELVHTNKEDGYKSVAYGNLVGYLIEAVKGQQETIEKLTSRINDIEKGEK